MLKDIRYAWRRLVQNPGLTVAAVVTIALGIGVNAALFTVYDAVALKPLPVSHPEEVVRFKRWFQQGYRGDQQYFFSYREYAYAREHSNVFSGIAAGSRPTPVTAVDGKLQAQLVSANYFDVLGIGTQIGRTFLADEDRTPGGNAVIVLSYPFWVRQFGADAEAVGRTIQVGAVPFTIIGVARESFGGTSLNPVVPDFWVPVSMQSVLVRQRDWINDPTDQEFNLLGRLKPGTTLRAAEPQIDALIRQYGTTFQEQDKTNLVTLEHTALFGNVDDVRFQAIAIGAMAVVGLILLLACANVANMMLAHGIGRRREIAIRLALGGGRITIIRQLVTESLIIGVLASALGVVLSTWATAVLWHWLTATIAAPFLGGLTVRLDLAPDAWIFAYAVAMAILSAVLFGFVPALQITRPGLADSLKDAGGLFGGAAKRSRLRSIFIAAQVGISMLFLLTAGLLMRGIMRTQNVDVGYETRNVFVISTDFGTDPVRAASLRQRVIERLRTLPEIRGVATGTAPLFGTWTPPIVVDGKTDRTLASYASDSYFDLLGIPILRGRAFTAQETRDGSPVAIISETTARRFWPGEDSLSKHLKLDMFFRGALTEFEVVGIAKDVRFANPTRIDPAHVYLPARPRTGNAGLLMRIQGDREQALDAARNALETIDPSLIPYLQWINVEQGPLAIQRFFTRFFTLFLAALALLGLGLASIGIYGVMAFLVWQRTKEIGIRIALGASSSAVLKAVILEGFRPVFIGAMLGCGSAMTVSWIFHKSIASPGASDFLQGVPFYDPVVFVGLSCFVGLVAALASAIPARRTLRVDPLVALRYE